MRDASSPTAVMLISCPDQKGLVAAVSSFVLAHDGNIVHADQHTDQEVGVFFQRVEFEIDSFGLARDEIAPAFVGIARRYGMEVKVGFSDEVRRVAILCSKEPHCLYDLLSRWRSGDLVAEVSMVISNHADHADAAGFFGVPYHHLPVTPATKAAQEARLSSLIDEAAIDVLVLARYMQILSPELCDRYRHRVINIHHSFLPAFVGARPYHQAAARGVKIIGATAHYATSELDEGPIIDQDVVRVSHRDDVAELIRKGRDLEKTVLARAVRYHLEHRVIPYGNKTVVFA